MEASQPQDETSEHDPSVAARVTAVVDASLALVSNVMRNAGRLVDVTRRDAVGIARDSEALYGAVAEQVRTAGVLARATPRFARVVGEGGRILASYRLHRMRAEMIDAETAAVERAALDRAGAERLYRMCVDLRGGVLKLGQIASCRADLLPLAYVEALSGLQDRVPPIDSAAIIARIEAELGAPIAERFASFDPEPIAAASLAQVHAAVLPDGTRVVIKVQIPGVGDIVEADLAAARALAALAGDLIPGTDVPAFVREIGRAVKRELDYLAEADNAEAFAALFAADPRVVVPRVFRELSTSRVLTMERVDGDRLTDWFDARTDAGELAARDRLLATLLDVFCAQTLTHGLLHADPHPGNFLVCGPASGTPDGPARLALLDFGCVQRFTPTERNAYARLGGAILGRDAAAMADALAAAGFQMRGGGDDKALHAIAAMVMDAFRDGAAAFEIDPREQLARALEILRDSPIIETPPSFALLGRVFATLGGLFLRYKPKIEPFGILAPHLGAALRAR